MLVCFESHPCKHTQTLTDAHSRVSDVPVGVLVVEQLAHLTVATHGVVLTVVAHAAAVVACCQVHGHVKVAGAGVVVAVAL